MSNGPHKEPFYKEHKQLPMCQKRQGVCPTATDNDQLRVRELPAKFQLLGVVHRNSGHRATVCLFDMQCCLQSVTVKRIEHALCFSTINSSVWIDASFRSLVWYLFNKHENVVACHDSP